VSDIIDFPNGYFLVDEEKERSRIREALQAMLDANSEMAFRARSPTPTPSSRRSTGSMPAIRTPSTTS
jgi:hypothetical protein